MNRTQKVEMIHRLRQQQSKWAYLVNTGATDRPEEVKTLLYAIQVTLNTLEKEVEDVQIQQDEV